MIFNWLWYLKLVMIPMVPVLDHRCCQLLLRTTCLSCVVHIISVQILFVLICICICTNTNLFVRAFAYMWACCHFNDYKMLQYVSEYEFETLNASSIYLSLQWYCKGISISTYLEYLEWFPSRRLLRFRVGDFAAVVDFLCPEMR